MRRIPQRKYVERGKACISAPGFARWRGWAASGTPFAACGSSAACRSGYVPVLKLLLLSVHSLCRPVLRRHSALFCVAPVSRDERRRSRPLATARDPATSSPRVAVSCVSSTHAFTRTNQQAGAHRPRGGTRRLSDRQRLLRMCVQDAGSPPWR
ncbi:hypothetical protein BDY21DRAFT_336283 [Lineolata rhizophorae]|uniref:Uncharacterized protein n=1 Tax=Lineolata rhizophorae TaxID=578093 RepID=A0A6A6P8E0_9PEZI|nr:hypothetical protein BDY21DRAFT_336283 [Lineolata rhizophorae]